MYGLIAKEEGCTRAELGTVTLAFNFFSVEAC